MYLNTCSHLFCLYPYIYLWIHPHFLYVISPHIYVHMPQFTLVINNIHLCVCLMFSAYIHISVENASISYVYFVTHICIYVACLYRTLEWMCFIFTLPVPIWDLNHFSHFFVDFAALIPNLKACIMGRFMLPW